MQLVIGQTMNFAAETPFNGKDKRSYGKVVLERNAF